MEKVTSGIKQFGIIRCVCSLRIGVHFRGREYTNNGSLDKCQKRLIYSFIHSRKTIFLLKIIVGIYSLFSNLKSQISIPIAVLPHNMHTYEDSYDLVHSKFLYQKNKKLIICIYLSLSLYPYKI